MREHRCTGWKLGEGVRSSSPDVVRISVVVPVRNAITYLKTTVPAVLAAAEATREVEILYVDNGSTDGTREFLRTFAHRGVRVLEVHDGTIGALRNAGAARASGQFLSFIDADCVIGTGYFESALASMAQPRVGATGCEVHMPADPHWIDAALHALHYVGVPRDVRMINAANFFVSRDAFARVGGFREDLVTGEDADICRRLLAAGYRLRESPGVRADHLGNPRTLRQFYRRSVWHGLGTVADHGLDRPTTMMLIHVAATAAAGWLVLGVEAPFPWRIGAAVALALAAPAATVLYRVQQTGRTPKIHHALVLYALYYYARLQAALITIGGGRGRYRK